MNVKQEKERVNWLSATLATQRSTISSFLDRLRGIAVKVGNSLPLHKKFMRLMDQVADDRDKELGIINEIEAIEKRHRELRQLKLLRRADSQAEAKRKRRLKELGEEVRENEKDDEDSPHRVSALEAFFVYMLFSSKSGGFFSSFGNLFSKGAPLSGSPTPQLKADKIEPTVE